MDLYRYLKKEHKKIDSLFDQVASAHRSKNIANAFSELETLLNIHADAEQAIFYKKLLGTDTAKSLSQHAIKEHKEVKSYLNKINKTDIKDKQWLIHLGELKHAVGHHVHVEETVIFQEAKKIMSKEESDSLAQEMQEYMQDHLDENKEVNYS